MLRERSHSQFNPTVKQNNQSVFQQLNSNRSSVSLSQSDININILQLQKMIVRMINQSEKKTEIIIKHLQRQVQMKVSKQQFASSLASKMSYSQLGTLLSLNAQKQNQFKNGKPQNNCRKSTKTLLEASSIFKEQQRQNLLEQLKAYRQQHAKQSQEYAKELQQNVQKTCVNTYQSMQELLNRSRQKYQQMWQLKQQVLKNMNGIENTRRQKQGQLQQLIFQKAERSELNKIFKLQDLMVIQMEQIKDRIKQSEKSIHSMRLSHERLAKQFDSKIEQLIAFDRMQKKEIKSQMKRNFQKFETCMNKALDLVESQTSTTQDKNTIKVDKVDSIIKQQCQNIFNAKVFQKQRIFEEVNHTNSRIQQTVNQLQNKISQLEQKQNQKHTLILNCQSSNQQNRQQVKSILTKIKELNESIKQKTVDIVQEAMKSKGQRIVDQIKQMNQQVCKRISLAISKTVNKENFDQQIHVLKEKQTIAEQFDMKIVEKISEIDKKLQSMCKVRQINQQKTGQAIKRILTQLKDRVKVQDIKSIISNLATGEELRQGILSLEQKTEKKIQKYHLQQQSLNQALCSQNIVAKWIWCEGQLKGGNLIPWDKQIINTLPQNFVYKKQEAVITVNKSGFYRIEMGFYSKKKPSIQIIVNGQTVISAVNNSSYVLHHSSGKLKDVIQSDVTGITLIDFFMLPQNARIAVSYIGQFLGEGFISIQRL